MDDTKKWWQSKTIWAALVVVLASALSIKGIVLPQGETVDVIMKIVAAIGGVVALYSRVTAKSKIK